MKETKKQVLSDSFEWTNIDYKIQLVTGKSSIKIIKAEKFTSYEPAYDVGARGWTQAIVNVTDYSKQYLRMITDQKTPIQDIIFYGGHINIHKYSSQPYKVFTFLVCDVRLGITGTQQTVNLQDCDSVLIEPENEEESFQYNYVLKQYNQYRPKYQITFTTSIQKQFRLSDYECSNCENRVPTIYCETEKIYFCEECCADHHKTKLMHKHNLQEIDKVNTLQNCKNHNQKYQLYCTQCQKYLCTTCTQKGVHSQNNDHPIKPITYIYDETAENIDMLPKSHLQKIDVLLHNLKIKRKELNDNYNQVKEMIEKQYQTSMQKLEDEMSNKYQLLNSCELELTYLKQKIEWARSFAIFQYKNLKPIHFFKAETKFEQFIKKLKLSEFQPIFLCKPDIIYESDVKIGPIQVIERVRNRSQHPITQVKQSEKVEHKVFSYDPNTQTPKKGELWHQLCTANLNFFLGKFCQQHSQMKLQIDVISGS